MNILNEAIAFANKCYGDLRRKGDGEPLVLHAMEAQEIASTVTDDVDILIATVLHDVVEDTGVPMEEIRKRFGDRVVELVESDTENKRPDMPPEESWMLRKQETVDFLRHTNDIGAKILVLGDKLSNMRSFYRLKLSEGDAMWQHFHQKDPEKHHWYYRSIAEALSCFEDTSAWREYNNLIKIVFDEKE